MSFLSKIQDAGFMVELSEDSFEVTPASLLILSQRVFLKSHKAEIISELKSVTLLEVDQHKILAYLDHIGETEPTLINDLLERCCNDREALAWVIAWADRQPKIQQPKKQQSTITYRHCQHFNSFNAHGGGAGICNAGVWSAGLCRWSDTAHPCDSYLKIN